MSSRIQYNDLPQYLKRTYVEDQIHKIIQQNKTTIVIHTKNKQKHVWSSYLEGWVLSNQQEAK